MRVRIPVCLIAAAIPCASIVTPACAGVLQTFGTAGSGSGQFSFPIGVAVDGSGNVYVSDAGNARIDHFNVSNFASTYTAFGSSGTGSGQFKQPQGIALDSSGNVLVADGLDNRIDRFSPTNFATSFTSFGTAGSGTGQFSNPSGLAFDSSGNVYVTDSGNSRLVTFNPTNFSGTFAGATLPLPTSVFADAAGIAVGVGYLPNGMGPYQGIVYIAGSNQIGEFTSTAMPLGAYGQGTGNFNAPYAMAENSAGDVYVADTRNNRIDFFNVQNFAGTFTTYGGLGSGIGQFSQPAGIALDSSGNIYVADSGNNRIVELSANTFTADVPSVWAASGTGDWNNSGNWVGGIPNSVDGWAAFNGAITANAIVTTSSSETLGKLVFNNSSGSYRLVGTIGTTLTMQTSSGSALVDVQAGTHEISLPLIIASNTTLQTDSVSSHLIVGDPVTINPGISLNMSGSGVVTFQSTVTVGSGGSFALASATYAPALILQTNASASVATSAAANANLLQVDSLSLGNGANLNLGNNDLIVHGGNLSTVTAAVATGYNAGGWNGNGASGSITSSAAAGDATRLTALGVGQASTAGTFDGQTVAAGDVEVKYTYYGDANLDGRVDGSDYSRIDNGYLSHLAGWQNGDFNYDGVINGSDYTLIDNAFNKQGPQIAAEIAAPTAQIADSEAPSAVPEPTAMGILGIGGLCTLARRNRRSDRRNSGQLAKSMPRRDAGVERLPWFLPHAVQDG